MQQQQQQFQHFHHLHHHHHHQQQMQQVQSDSQLEHRNSPDLEAERNPNRDRQQDRNRSSMDFRNLCQRLDVDSLRGRSIIHILQEFQTVFLCNLLPPPTPPPISLQPSYRLCRKSSCLKRCPSCGAARYSGAPRRAPPGPMRAPPRTGATQEPRTSSSTSRSSRWPPRPSNSSTGRPKGSPRSVR